jgi:predicted DNA-binding transcriptional regulator AlpA
MNTVLPVLTTNDTSRNEAQKRFDELYISSTEIASTLGINRASIFHARNRGMLPEPIIVNNSQLYLWERASIMGIIEAWKQSLDFRKNPKAFLGA